MNTKQLRASERYAKAIVEAWIPGAQVEEHDTGCGDGRYDFDIVFEGGRRGALEVTESTQADRRNLRMSVQDREPLVNLGTIRSWNVLLRPGANLKQLRRDVGQLLREMERCGDVETQVYHNAVWYPPGPLRELILLGVDGLSSWVPRSGQLPTVFLQITGDGGRVSPLVILDALMDEAQKADNTAKLGRAKTDERHFFVWVDPADQYLIWRTMQDLIPPPDPESIPAEMTSLWVATSGPGGGICFRFESRRGWEVRSQIPIDMAS